MNKLRPPYPETFIQAQQSPKGIKISMPNKGWAHHCAQYLYKQRVRDRKKSMKIYDPSHHMYGESAFEKLSISICCNKEQTNYWLEIRNFIGEITDFEIEEL